MKKLLSLSLVVAFSLSVAGSARAADKAELEALVEGNTTFAVDLYQHLKSLKGNFFFSPYSISSALGMTYAGARGATEAEMAKTLRFTLGQDRLHQTMGKLMTDLNTRKLKGRWPKDPQAGKRPFELVVANALWGQEGYPFKPSFLRLTRKHYEAGLTELDFRKDVEKARQTINAWVEKKTKDKIRDLIRQGQLSPASSLVLTNAIYFKSAWAEPFQKSSTRPKPFHMSNGTTVQVPVMQLIERFPYLEKKTFRAVSLPYSGNALSMLVLVPREVDGLATLEEGMKAGDLADWEGEMAVKQVHLGLPKFKFTSRFILNDALEALGMKGAFALGTADFTGMAGTDELFIGRVIHQAFVDVNEAGTEAAAATAVVMEGEGPPEPAPVLMIDRPFLFLIRDNKTGSILFMGRVLDPRGD